MQEPIINQTSDKEIWISENQLYLGENNTVYDIAKGETNEAIALAIKEGISKLASLCSAQANLLVDLSNAGKPSPAARKIFLSITEDEKLRKIAMVGLHPVARVLATSIIAISGRKNVQFFKSRSEAIAWFKEN